MPSNHLTITAPTTRHIAPSERDVEVPAGHHRFVIKQSEPEQVHTFHLRHPETELELVGVVQAEPGETPSLETAVIHHAPHTKAQTTIKTLARHKAEPRYRGMIRIEPNSSGCESYLTHQSLLIGPHAQSWSTPSLEILNNEVKCSHAATIRTITPLDLFYLQSRGLSVEIAQTILIDAFLSDVQN
jgi:Fe-S cluster assembly protein SufD